LCLTFAAPVSAQDRFFGVDLRENDRAFPAERPAPDPAATSQAEADRYLTARERIQRRAAWEAQQRRERIAAAKWMGYSPSRPPVSAIPSMSGPSYAGVRVYYGYPGRLFIAPAGPPTFAW
jgi:hypothetical protein